jgi:hypothetical protein
MIERLKERKKERKFLKSKLELFVFLTNLTFVNKVNNLVDKHHSLKVRLG